MITYNFYRYILKRSFYKNNLSNLDILFISMSFFLADINFFLVLLHHFFKFGVKLIIDAIELISLSEVHNQSRLQSGMWLLRLLKICFSLFIDLDCLGLKSSKRDILVLHQALSHQHDCKVALVIYCMKFDGVKLLLKQSLSQHDKSSECRILSHNYHIVFPGSISICMNRIVLRCIGSYNLLRFGVRYRLSLLFFLLSVNVLFSQDRILGINIFWLLSFISRDSFPDTNCRLLRGSICFENRRTHLKKLSLKLNYKNEANNS